MRASGGTFSHTALGPPISDYGTTIPAELTCSITGNGGLPSIRGAYRKQDDFCLLGSVWVLRVPLAFLVENRLPLTYGRFDSYSENTAYHHGRVLTRVRFIAEWIQIRDLRT
jgi:hypothetical protein